MVAERACRALTVNGEPCRAAPLLGGDYCLMHDPEHSEEMAEARKVGGGRRRKERAISAAFDLIGLDFVGGLRRLLEIAAVDLVTLDNTVPRNRAMISAVSAGAKLLQTGDLEERVAALEAAAPPRPGASTRTR